jgi:plasmid stability protein
VAISGAATKAASFKALRTTFVGSMMPARGLRGGRAHRYHDDSKGGPPMAQVLVRNLDEAVVERLKARAAAKQRSLEAELREILEEAARPDRDAALARLRAAIERTPAWTPGEPTAAELIREDRDSR